MKWKGKIWLLVIPALYLFLNVISTSEAESPQTYDAEGIYGLAQKATFYVRVFREDGTLKDVGTGFLVSREGEALTAYHVVKDAARISCVLDDGTVADSCKVTASDEKADTAWLQLSPPQGGKAGYGHLTLRTSKANQGERVFAIGYPMKETKIITEGIVNSPKAEINGRERILVSSQIVNGMSGGPVIDKYGAVVGIVSGSLRTMNNIHLVVGADAVSKTMAKEDIETSSTKTTRK